MNTRTPLCNVFWFAFLCCLWPLGLRGQAFSVTSGAGTLVIHPGDKDVALPVVLSGDGSFAGPVTVTLAGLPSGITVKPVLLSPGASGTLLLSASVAADQEAFPASNPGNPDTAASTATVVAFAGEQRATAPLLLTVSLQNPSFAPQPNQINLPILRIDTNGVAIADKATNVPGTLTLTSADTQTFYLPGTAGSDATATFHLHGNTTLVMPKKSYHLKLNTSADLLSSLGVACGYVTSAGKPVCDKSKSYILLANYDDKTLLRDWSAMALANAIPIGGQFLGESATSPSPSGTATLLPWAPHSVFVELYLNGQYQGTYQLTEEIKVDSHRVNITEMSNGNVSGSALTGGYLLEVDQRQDEDFTWTTPHGVMLGLDDPDFSPEVPEQTAYITNDVNQAEAALFSSQYTDPAVGWRTFFDQTSAVNFFVVNELMGNLDAGTFYGSVFLYKDRNNPLLYMGPVWDFDISSGNVNYAAIIDPSAPWMSTQGPWFPRLLSDPVFKAATKQQWNALKQNGILTNWLNSISDQATKLEQSQRNNFGRWPMQGIRVWPNPEAAGSYDGEVAYFKNWIAFRMGYMDAFLNGLPATSTTLALPDGTLRAGTPVTLTAKVTGAQPTGTVTFSYNSIILGQAILDSSGTATLTSSNLVPGGWFLEAYYNGDANNQISGAPETFANVLPPLVQTTASLATSGSFSYGAPATLTAAVIGVSGAAPPTGTVTFTANGTVVGSVPLSGAGVATLNTSTLPLGSNLLQATYSGDQNFAGATSNTVSASVTQGAATVSLGNLQTTYTGSAQAVTVTTQPAGLSYSVTYDGASSAPSAAGTYRIVATLTSPDYAGSATGTMVIAKASATVTLSGLSVGYTGAPQAAMVTTQPAGLNVALTYDGATTVPSAPGSYAVVATVNDPNYTGTAAGTLRIAQVLPTVNWPASGPITFGTPLAGAQLNATANVPGSFLYQPGAGTVLNAGTQTLSATFVPTDATIYASVATSVQLVVNKQLTTTSLATSASSVNPNQPVTLTATVASGAGTQPTGSVSFFDGTTLLGTQPLANGTASYSTSTLTSGSHTISASYGGDSNYDESSSSAGGTNLAVAPLDFTFSSNGETSVTLAGGDSDSVTYALAPMYGKYPGPVTFAVTGLPSNMHYTISPATVAADAGPVKVVVTFAEGAAMTAQSADRESVFCAFALLLLVPLAGRGQRKTAKRRLLPLVLFGLAGCAALTALSGCGGASQPAQTYHVLVTASSSAMQQTAGLDITAR